MNSPLRPLALGKSVFGETVVIRRPVAPDHDLRIRRFAEHHSLHVINTPIEGTIILSTLTPERDREGNYFIYCGRSFARTVDRLLTSHKDVLSSQASVSDIRGTCGEFHLTEIGESSISISADFLGVQPLFKYDHAGYQVVATNYHLMLLLLKTLGAPLSLDIEKSIEMLAERHVFTSSASINMKHCSINSIDEHFQIDKSGVRSVKDHDLHDILYNDDKVFDYDAYQEMITLGRDEIVDNVRLAFQCDSFDKVIVDLSGGLDSRIVFAACTVLPQGLVRQKIRVNTQFAPSPNAKKGGDLEVASLINSIYSYPLWRDHESEGIRQIDISDYSNSDLFYANKISKVFGTHKNFNHIVPKHVDFYAENATRLSGFLGGVYREGGSEGGHRDRMDRVNGYTNNRARYMSTRAFENILAPLASRNLLKAARFYQWTHPGAPMIVPQMDVLAAINPLFSLLPYHNKDLQHFMKDSGTRSMTSFPHYLRLESSFPEAPTNTVVKNREHNNPYRRFTLEKRYALAMLDVVEQCDGRFAPIVERLREAGDELTRDRNARKLSMLWSIYFQLDILNGNGDFPALAE